jgi:hypothetical protein
MANRDWSIFDWNFPLVTSASAITKYRSCPRMWVFEKVWKLFVPFIAAGPFGEAAHDALERWLSADELGRGPDGKPVEVWPEGWDQGLTLAESGLVQALVDASIKAGLVVRAPGTAPEASFQRDVCDGVSIIGFGDVVAADAYEDHKTTKHFRYCETQESLAENVQMLIGAAEVLTRAMERGEKLDVVRIAHNYMLKDPRDPEVKKVEVALTPQYVKDFWLGEIVPTCKEMLEVKQNFSCKSPEDWDQVEGPREKGICSKYRGCAFRGICGGTETVQAYKERMEMVKAIESAERSDNMGKSIFDKLREQRGQQEEAAPAEKTEKVEATSVDETPAEPKVIETDRAPWYQDGCVACSANAVPGYNSKGFPCRACTDKADLDEAEFDKSMEDGKTILVLRSTGDKYVLPGFNEVQAKKTKDPAPPKESKPTEPKKAREQIKKDVKPKKTGRPKAGFTLIYGSVKRGKRNVQDLNLVLKEVGADLAKALGKESYFDIDFGRRRDMLAAKAEVIAQSLGAAFVVVSNLEDADVRAFAAAIEPYASSVVVPHLI